MNAYDRLLLEEIPTGTFGGARDRSTEPTPATVAAYHCQLLDTEVAAYDRQHVGQRPPRHNHQTAQRHLQPVPDTQETAA